MRAVANSSVLISLSALSQLELLPQRFGDGVLVPDAVWHEVVLTGQGRRGAQEVAQATWLSVQAAHNQALVSLLRTELDAGEAEAIALAQEQNISTVLLDEKQARHYAQRVGLQPLGTVGILIWARQTGLIDNLKQQLDALRVQGNFRLSQSVYEVALRTVGELT